MKCLPAISLLFLLFNFSLFAQELTPCEEPYPQVTNLSVAFGEGALVLNWAPIIGSQACRIQIRPFGSSESQYTLIEGADLGTYSISGDVLLFQTQYEARVSCGCPGDPPVFGPYSSTVAFWTSTVGQIVPCADPYPVVSGLIASPTEEADGIHLMWNPISKSKGCRIEFQPVDGPLEAMQVLGTELSEYVIPGSQLLADFDYNWRIRCGCSFDPLVQGPWSLPAFFNTGEVGDLAGFMPKPKFKATPQAPLTGAEVQFKDVSPFEPTSWLWDFGDGTTSTEADPAHTYASPGAYNVSLTVANEFGENTSSIEEFIQVFDPVCPQSVTDLDGNQYTVVQIGNACWTGENLKVTQFNNGDEIPNLEPASEWLSTTEVAYCNFNNDQALGDSTGRHYNGYVVLDERNVCPAGWHVSAESDWLTMEEVMGMPTQELTTDGPERGRGRNIGGQLKADQFWSPFNIGGADTYGFGALPLGYRFFVFIDFVGLQTTARFHVPNDLGSDPELHYRGFSYLSMGISKISAQLGEGMSIRCVQD
ncbi:FISUMP domain-containing protein [Cryomorphaceae bacterium 1068]|nr:FISUMP domain-containing protein [Cryomorphaceae bacterium 1068]